LRCAVKLAGQQLHGVAPAGGVGEGGEVTVRVAAVVLAQHLADGVAEGQLERAAGFEHQGPEPLVALVDPQDVPVGGVGPERLARLGVIASTSKVDAQSFIADALDLSGREGLVGNLETTRDQVRDPVGQILAVFAIMILGVWTATQWTADQLGH